MKTLNSSSIFSVALLHLGHVGMVIRSLGLGLGNMLLGGMWSLVVAGFLPQIAHVT